MTQRLKTAGLMLVILVLGIGLTVVVTEYAAGADASDPPLLTTSDVVQALADHGVVVVDDNLPAHHPLLGISGSSFTASSATIEVFVYASVTGRVADEQLIQRHLMQLRSLGGDGDEPLRVTSARNVLMLFHADSGGPSAAIISAARSLASGAD